MTTSGYYLQNKTGGRVPLGTIPQGGDPVEVVLLPGRQTEHPLTDAQINAAPEVVRALAKGRLVKIDASKPLPTRLSGQAGIGKASDPARLAAKRKLAAGDELPTPEIPKTRARVPAGAPKSSE